MHPLSLLHLFAGLGSLIVGLTMLWLPKGSPRHRLLGWIYVIAMSGSLIGILIRTREHWRPFAGYAVLMLIVLLTAVLLSRWRRNIPTWRAWHGGLMSLTLLGSIMAASSIFGGVAVGAANGAPFYRMFNLLIAAMTLLGLAIIYPKAVIWGRSPAPRDLRARSGFTALVLVSSGLLIAAQWSLAFP